MAKNSQRRGDARKNNRDRRARLDELRKQQRAAERRKNILFAGAAVVIALALIAAAVIPAYLHDRAQKRKNATGYQTTPTAAERAAGCTGVHNDPVSAGGEHVPTPIDYTKEKYGDTKGGTPPIPPSGGKHNAVSLGETNRFYPLSEKPRPERAVHNLEHGFVDVWYDDQVPQQQVDELKTLATTLPRLLAVGWWQSELPAGKHVVLTSWGRTERCATVSAPVIRSFYSKHVDAPFAPETGLPAIQGADSIPAGQLPQTTPSPATSATATLPPSSGSPSASPSKK